LKKAILDVFQINKNIFEDEQPANQRSGRVSTRYDKLLRRHPLVQQEVETANTRQAENNAKEQSWSRSSKPTEP